MRKLVIILSVCFISIIAKAQGTPAGFPTNIFSGKWYQYKQFLEFDSMLLTVSSDTSGLKPRSPALKYWGHASVDSGFWYYNGVRWHRIAGTILAGNGLTNRNDSIILGGTLNQATVISFGGNSLTFGFSANNYTAMSNSQIVDVYQNGDTTINIRYQNGEANSLTYRTVADNTANFGYGKSQVSNTSTGALIGAYYPFTSDTLAHVIPAILDSTSFAEATKANITIWAKHFYLTHNMPVGIATDSILVRSGSEVKLLAPRYRVYTALLTQTGTSPPVATVLENTFGEALTWSYSGVGQYVATFATVSIDSTKVWTNPSSLVNRKEKMDWNSIHSMALTIADGNTVISKYSIEIRLYY